MNYNSFISSAISVLTLVALTACDKGPSMRADKPSTPSESSRSMPMKSSTSQSFANNPEENAASITELIETAKTLKGTESARIIRKISTHRTNEVCAVLIKFLREEDAHVGGKLPSLEEAKRFDSAMHQTGAAPSDMKDFEETVWHFRRAAEAALHLVMLDMPEGRQAAYEFRDQIKTKWSGNEVGEKLLSVMNVEFQQAEADLKSGVVPWKTKQ